MQMQYPHALCYPPCSTCMSLKNQQGAAEKTAGHVLKAMLLLCYLLISAATAYLLLSSEQTTK